MSDFFWGTLAPALGNMVIGAFVWNWVLSHQKKGRRTP